MTSLWTAHDLLEATGGTMTLPFHAAGVSIDTRTLRPGDLFIALQGETGDGHDFVADALAKGAAGAMVHRPVPGAAILLVDDTLAGLHRMGGYARERFGGQLVAITGSVGKTTTKEMLRTILATFGVTHAAVASYNNHWGVPLTLARMPPDAAFCVAEIGMNHAGEITPLARLARPHVAVITAVEKAHIGFLGSIEAIADEKATIMRGLEHDGVAVLPADSPMLARLRAAAEGFRVTTFGAAPSADVRLVGRTEDADGSEVVAEINGRSVQFRLNAPGRHMAMNALAAIAAAVHLSRPAGEVAEQSDAGEGSTPQHPHPPLRGDLSHAVGEVYYAAAARALEGFTPIAGRGAKRQIPVSGGTALLLDESYNGNGASMRAALAVLRLQPGRRRLAVLGDMLELGDDGPPEHRALAADVIASADRVYACGPLMRGLYDSVPEAIRAGYAPDAASLAPIVAQSVAPGDVILVKGSLGSRMKLVVNALERQAEAV
jgi:UDP-N-acetylmuramoyl-tripeptide--D-alanyl-D-alanine ligase